MVKKISDSQIQARLKNIPGWEPDEFNTVIQKEFTFKNFTDAMVFVNKVAELAEEHEHHPDICISYNSVVIMLTTHEVEGLSGRDFQLADDIEKIVE